MKVGLMFPSEFLAAADLQECKDHEITLTISKVVGEKLRVEGGGKEHKWVLSFKEMEERNAADKRRLNKRLVLNKTNAKAIAKKFGQETDAWAGKQITLVATTCDSFGETVDCIRVKGAKAKRRRNSPDAIPDHEPPDDRFADAPSEPPPDTETVRA